MRSLVFVVWIGLIVALPAIGGSAHQAEPHPTSYLPVLLSMGAPISQLTPTPGPAPTPDPSLPPGISPTPGPAPTPQPEPPASYFGMVMTSIAPDRGLDSAVAAGASWIRSNNSLLWRDVEPIEGAGYHWDTPAMQRIEQEMLLARQQRLRLIVVVRGSPRWATTPYSADCAPINPSKYARFADFMAAIVARYSQPPYSVLYWQIGNEPDANIFPNDSGFGCWGVKTDPYYGGRAYGHMLNVVYPAIKAANPAVKVLHGSLLLNTRYHPEIPESLSGRFLEGVFLAGAANSFDILTYNAYVWASNENTADWKTPYLLELMQTYNIPRKPMMITEQALLCTTACPKLQSYWVGRFYARAASSGLLGSLWYIYDSDSFNRTALVEPGNPARLRPAYSAYKHAAGQLSGASYLGPLLGQPSTVEGYRFAVPAGELTIFWSPSAKPVAIPVADHASVACSTWDGAPLPCVNNAGSVALNADIGPVYVVASAQAPQ